MYLGKMACELGSCMLHLLVCNQICGVVLYVLHKRMIQAHLLVTPLLHICRLARVCRARNASGCHYIGKVVHIDDYGKPRLVDKRNELTHVSSAFATCLSIFFFVLQSGTFVVIAMHAILAFLR